MTDFDFDTFTASQTVVVVCEDEQDWTVVSKHQNYDNAVAKMEKMFEAYPNAEFDVVSPSAAKDFPRSEYTW
jgi:hypothetical protein